MNKWKKIWNNRKPIAQKLSSLRKLLKVDGFDTGAGKLDEKDWRKYVKLISEILKVKKNDSIFEVGCGAGAFLYLFYKQGREVGGIDYSRALINIAKNVMKDMSFEVKEASRLNTGKKYDFVVSFGVFHYFPNIFYAKTVIEKMINKANKAAAIFDIPNLELKKESEEARKQLLPEGEYQKKYKGLKHLYYSKKWFQKLIENYNCDIVIFDQAINNYSNSDYRFNVIINKKT